MTVKTGQAWAGTFVTLDSTGALAAGTPSGVLYVDGTANGAAVTISGSNPYKWAVTLPTLTAGQRVDMYITATIATIATAGIVASEQADTSLLSDGVAVASIANDAITAAALKADAGAEIADAILDEAVVGSYTLRQLVKVMAAALAGKLSGGGTTTLTFRGVDDTSNVIVATVDTNGNRTNIVLTV
jgi:hypothetical protein